MMFYDLTSKLRFLIIGLICIGYGFGSTHAIAYEEIEVHDGGTITGKITLDGPIPQARVFPVVLYPFGEYCKRISDGQGYIHLKEFNVDVSGGIQDVVVSVQAIKKGKPFSPMKNNFVSENCMFHPSEVSGDKQFEVHQGMLHHVHPLVGVMRNNEPLHVINRDPIVHNGQVFQKEKGNIVLNFPLPVSDKSYGGVVNFDKGKHIVQIVCGMHEFMQTWAWIVDNPYYAKTNKDGSFIIDQLPPGTYKVTIWHPHMKPVEQEITILPKGVVSLNVALDASQVVRPHYETQTQFRVSTATKLHGDLEGCEGPFCVQ